MNREQCEGCAYFRLVGGGHNGDGYRFCHYMLHTGMRREVGENEVCLSKSGKQKRVVPPFYIPTRQL